MLHDAITAALVWIFIGSCFLVILNAMGVIDRSKHARDNPAALWLAMARAVVWWPPVAIAMLKHPRKLLALFAQNMRAGR